MKLILPDREIRVFSILRRMDQSPNCDFSEMHKLVQVSDAHGYSGILLFQNNKVNIDPWFFAQVLLQSSASLSPFIAVNPVYMHPFTAARMLHAITSYYGRKLFLNFIAGTSLTDQQAMGDELPHDERFDRLSEYISIFDGLLRSQSTFSFHGKYYTVKNLHLPSMLPAGLLPHYFLAGSSDKGAAVAEKFSMARMQMANEPSPGNYRLSVPKARALHFGIVAASTSQLAWNRVEEVFNKEIDEFSRELLSYTAENTDAAWKKQLIANTSGKLRQHKTYCLLPFKNSRSDCPYLVGSYEEVADAFISYICEGVMDFVIEIADTGEDFEHAAKVFELVKSRMQVFYKEQPVAALDFRF